MKINFISPALDLDQYAYEYHNSFVIVTTLLSLIVPYY